jgi:hypothetical protein
VHVHLFALHVSSLLDSSFIFMYKNTKPSKLSDCEEIVFGVLDTAKLGEVEREEYARMLCDNINHGMSMAAATRDTVQSIIDDNNLNIDFTYREVLYVCDRTIIG